MNKNTRNLLAAFCAVAALAVVLVIVISVIPQQEEVNHAPQTGDNSAPVNPINIVRGGVENLSSMTVTNQKGSYTIRRTADSSYQVEGLEHFLVNNNVVYSVLTSGLEPHQEESLGEMENLADFGLNPSVATVEVRFVDGTDVVYHLGNQVPGREESRYMRVGDSKEVSIINADERLLESSATFVQPVIVSEEDAVVSGFTLSGSNFPQPITIKRLEDGTYRMTSPIDTPVDPAQAEYCTVTLSSLTGIGVEVLHPDQSALEKLGLTNPTAVIEYTINGEQITLSAAPKNDSVTYVMRSGVDAVFEVYNDSVEMWTQTSRYALQEKQILPLDIGNVSSLTVKAGDSLLSLTITRQKDAFKSTEQITYYTYTPAVDGAQVSVTGYQKLMEYLSTLSLTDAQPGQSLGTPAAEVTYQCFDGTQGALQLYTREDGSFDASFNDILLGQVADTTVEKLTQLLQALLP